MRSKIGLLVLVVAGWCWTGAAWAAIPVWEPLGPPGGDRFMVKISPADNATLFVMGFSALHRSRNSADEWTRLDTGLMSLDRFADIDFKGPSAQQLFVAGNFYGVWYSPDEGDTWEQRSNGLPTGGSQSPFLPVSSVAVGTNGTVFAGIANEFGIVGQGPVRRSDDDGLNWVPDSQGIADSNAGKTITLFTRDASQRLWVMVHGSGVYEYLGNGWTNRNGNLPDTAARRGTFLAAHPHQPNHLLLATEDAWVWRTIDGGQSWTEIPKPTQLASLQVLPLTYNITIDPNNSNFILIRTKDSNGGLEAPLFNPRLDQNAGAGLYVSYDGGTTWNLNDFAVLRMAIDTSTTVNTQIGNMGAITRSRTWYGTSGGTLSMIRSTNGLETLEQKINKLDALYVNTIYAHPNPPNGYAGLIYAASEEGLWLLSNGVARAWANADSASTPVYTWSFAANFATASEVFYSVGHPAWDQPQKRGVYRVRLVDFDQGHTPESHQILSNTGVWKVVTTPAQPNWIYVACQEVAVRVSRDGGATFQPERTGLPIPASVTDLVLDADGEPLFASLRTSNGNPYTFNNPWIPRENENGAVYRFDVTNRVWSQINGLTRAVYGLHYRPDTSPPVLYAASGGGIYRHQTPPGGWTLISPPILATSILSEPDDPNTLFASSSLGVLRTFNAGNQWEYISEGLPVPFVSQITRNPLDGALYAATIGGSVSRLFGATGHIAMITSSVASVAFGSVAQNQTRLISVSIGNTGDADLILTAITPTHAALGVASAGDLPTSVPPGETIDVVLSFTPNNTTPVDAGFTFSANAGNAPFLLPATGQGYTETGTLQVSVDPIEASWTATLPWGAVTTRVGNLPPITAATGLYTLVWQPLEGYGIPTNQPVELFLNEGESRIIEGVYGAPQPGILAFASDTFEFLETVRTARVTVVRSGGSDGVVSVDYQTVAITATPGEDYITTSGTLVFEDSVTNLNVNVPILTDGINEPPETFRIDLFNPTGGAELQAPTNATITIHDATGGLMLMVTEIVIEEADTNAVVWVERTGGVGGEVSASFFTSNITALAGLDYTATNGALTWLDGTGGAQAVEVRILDDSIPEPEKRFAVHLASTVWTGPSVATVVITDSDVLTTTTTTTTSTTTTAPPPATVSLGAAVEQPSLSWSAGGNRGWYGQSVISKDGVDAARSGTITHNQQSWMQTAITGPTSVGFWWRLSAETNDTLTFTINGQERIKAGGTQEWRWNGFTLPAGSHTLRWTYAKNGSINGGADAAWVDGVAVGMFGAALPIDGNWFLSDWYGYFTPSILPWTFHAQHGYHYFFGNDPENAAFYDNATGLYFWTSRSFYPYMYRYLDGVWFWYQIGSKNPRRFLNLQTGQWERF